MKPIAACAATRAAKYLIVLTGSLLFTACGCNLVGCADGLRVRLDTLPTGAFQVELLVGGVVQPAPIEATCGGTSTCYQEVQFRNFNTDNVSVRVTTANGTRVTPFAKVVYTRSYPNGRGCGPTCRYATVTALVP